MLEIRVIRKLNPSTGLTHFLLMNQRLIGICQYNSIQMLDKNQYSWEISPNLRNHKFKNLTITYHNNHYNNPYYYSNQL